MRTAILNRIHASLAMVALWPTGIAALISKKGGIGLERTLKSLPPDTSKSVEQELALLAGSNRQRQVLESRMRQQIQSRPNMPLLKPSLAWAIFRPPSPKERSDRSPSVGRKSRWQRRNHHQGRCRPAPRLRPEQRQGPFRFSAPTCAEADRQANRHLKWAFVACPSRRPAKPPTSLPSIAPRGAGSDSTSHYSYGRIQKRKGPSVAAGAVARPLSEATAWMPKKQESYREPNSVQPRQGQARPSGLSQRAPVTSVLETRR